MAKSLRAEGTLHTVALDDTKVASYPSRVIVAGPMASALIASWVARRGSAKHRTVSRPDPSTRTSTVETLSGTSAEPLKTCGGVPVASSQDGRRVTDPEVELLLPPPPPHPITPRTAAANALAVTSDRGACFPRKTIVSPNTPSSVLLAGGIHHARRNASRVAPSGLPRLLAELGRIDLQHVAAPDVGGGTGDSEQLGEIIA
jgi:hypothetical protein